jgi:hypothetical protein
LERIGFPSGKNVGSGNGQQRYISGALDRLGDIPLMPRAVSGNSPGNNLAALTDEILKRTRVFVVYGYLLVGAETTYLPTLKGSLLPRATASLWGSLFSHLSILHEIIR